MDKRQIAGIGFVLAQVASFSNGLIGARYAPTQELRNAGKNRITSAILWVTGSIALAVFGTNPMHRQKKKLRGKLASEIQKEGIAFKDERWRNAASSHEKRSVWQKTKDLLYNYPIEAGNTVSALASLFVISSGIKRVKEPTAKKSGYGDITFSIAIIIGSLISIFVPEKTSAQLLKEGKSGTIWGGLQRQPLKYMFLSFLGSDLFNFYGAYGEYSDAKKRSNNDEFKRWGYAMSGLTATASTCFLAGDFTTGTGSKKLGGGTDEERKQAQEEIMAEAADVLLTAPMENRQKIVEKTARFLTKQPELRMVDKEPAELVSDIFAAAQKKQAASLLAIPFSEQVNASVSPDQSLDEPARTI